MVQDVPPGVRRDLAKRRRGDAPARIHYCRDCGCVHLICQPCCDNPEIQPSTDPRWAEAVQNHDTHDSALEALIAHQLARHPEMKP